MKDLMGRRALSRTGGLRQFFAAAAAALRPPALLNLTQQAIPEIMDTAVRAHDHLQQADHLDPQALAGRNRPADGANIERGNVMRTILATTATAIVFAFSAASAYANGPNWSPYEILAPQAVQVEAPPPEQRAAAYANDNQGQGCYQARVRIHGAFHNVQVCD